MTWKLKDLKIPDLGYPKKVWSFNIDWATNKVT